MAYARLHQAKLRMADHTVVSEDECSHNVHARRAKREVTSGLFSCANRMQITHTLQAMVTHTHTARSQWHDTEWLATSTSQHVTHSSLGMSLGESSRQPRLPFAHSVQGQTWWLRVRWLWWCWSRAMFLGRGKCPHAMKQATKRPESRFGATGEH